MSFSAIDAWWWPYLFILLAGWLATDFWRFLGVFIGGRLPEESELLILVRCIATALVAAVVANLVFFPTGALSAVPLLLRIGALASGFLAYVLTGKRMLLGVLAGESVLVGGIYLS